MRIMGDIDFYELESIDEKLTLILKAVKATKENKNKHIQTIKTGDSAYPIGREFKVTYRVPDESMIDDVTNSLLPYAIFMNTFKEFSNVLVEFLSEIKDETESSVIDRQIETILEVLRDLS